MLRRLPILFALLCGVAVLAQPKKGGKAEPAKPAEALYSEKLYNSLQWRNIGPFRGGRSCAVAGVPNQPNLFYFGATGGGVWKTTDGGSSWQNISDGFFGGSIGSIAVSISDPNVIYVGGGEKTLRGNVSFGYGVWKSLDAGKSWTQMGLANARHISRMRIHPANPDLVYAAVIGDIYKPSEERGVYRSKDGGKTWERILYVNDEAGAVDLLLDPTNPRTIYATTWRARRTPYSFSSGGQGSGIWKSTNGGDTWKEISRNEGLPKQDTLGIIGVAVSPANPERVWALVEAKNGGLFRSENGGQTWRLVSDNRDLRQRAWYYTRVYADPKDPEGVYVMNVDFLHSTDGGRSFKQYETPHGDHHDLWIDPNDPKRMIVADDGGAQVSYDGGQRWSTYMNQPTAQFYRVTTDNSFPYRIYVAQQDNSTIRIAHRSEGGVIGEEDWEETAGGESAHIAVDPEDSDIVYGGSYDGFLTRVDHRRKQVRAINVWPDNPMGHGAEGMKYRFQWNFPIFFSPHNSKKLYACSNQLHVTTDGGQHWDIISPDLTRNDPSKLGPSGGPITKDNTSVEYYCTIFAAAESPLEEGCIWTGSDDGLVHVTQNGGKTWENVTPKVFPEWTMINSIDVSTHEKGTVYVAATSYKSGDYKPYLAKTTDYGKTWKLIVNGIKEPHFTRVVRADPDRKGLLYAGTEAGMYISFNDGESWQPFQMNMPVVPITDLAVKQQNLIATTQGRGIWIIDDLTVLHQLNDEVKNAAKAHLYKPMPSYRIGGRQAKTTAAGTNHPGGVMLHFYLNKPDTSKSITLEILEADGDLIKKFDSKAKEAGDKLAVKDSANLFVWDMRYKGAEKFDGMILWWASLAGPRAVPGQYKARLTVDGQAQEQAFDILPDPRSESSVADLQEQFDFLNGVCAKVSEAHVAIKKLRQVRKDIMAVKGKVKGDSTMKEIADLADAIDKQMKAVEEALYQTQNRSGQDPLNYPIRLTNKLAHLNSLVSMGAYKPTDQDKAVKEEISKAIDAQLAILKKVFDEQVPKFNQMIWEKKIEAVKLD